MNDFSMTKYYHQYQEAVTKLGRLKSSIEYMRAGILYAADPKAELAKVEAAEAELQELEIEVDDLWCLSNTGKHRAELTQAKTAQWKNMSGLEYKPHWPEARKRSD